MTPSTHRLPAPHRSAARALDPYFIDECTFTRGQILRARGMSPSRRPAGHKAGRPTRRSHVAA